MVEATFAVSVAVVTNAELGELVAMRHVWKNGLIRNQLRKKDQSEGSFRTRPILLIETDSEKEQNAYREEVSFL